MTAWKRGAKPPAWFPRRGEVVLIDLDKERPALILFSDSLNALSLDVCVLPEAESGRGRIEIRVVGKM